VAKKSDSRKFFSELLSPLGFSRYDDYLNSPLWAGIRTRVFESKGRTCLRCLTAKANQIHHERYDLATMRGDTLLHLTPICGDCHQSEHGISKKPSTSPAKARKKKNRRSKASRKRRRREREGVVRPTKKTVSKAQLAFERIARLASRGVTNFHAFGISQGVGESVARALREGRSIDELVDKRFPVPSPPKQNRLPCPLCKACGRPLSRGSVKRDKDTCGACRQKANSQKVSKAVIQRNQERKRRQAYIAALRRDLASMTVSEALDNARRVRLMMENLEVSDPLSQEYRDIVR
jgi:uncharacterized Zn finger protein (UPF0148 family)